MPTRATFMRLWLADGIGKIESEVRIRGLASAPDDDNIRSPRREDSEVSDQSLFFQGQAQFKFLAKFFVEYCATPRYEIDLDQLIMLKGISFLVPSLPIRR